MAKFENRPVENDEGGHDDGGQEQGGKHFGESLVRQGGTLTKSEDGFATAIAVQAPRDLELIKRNVLFEARQLGPAAQYSIPFGIRKCPACATNHPFPKYQYIPKTCTSCGQALVNMVKGGTVKLAEMLVSNWGNTVTKKTIVNENSREWTVEIRLIDLERGQTIIDQAVILKPRKIDDQREIEKTLNAGKSRLMRNLAFAIVPPWLKSAALEVALDETTRVLLETGLRKAAKKIIRGLVVLGVPEAIALKSVGFEKIDDIKDGDDEHAEILAELNSKWAAIKNGEEKASDLFPELEDKAEEPKKEPPAPKEEAKKPKKEAPKETAGDLLNKMAGEEKKAEPAGPSDDDVDKAKIILQERFGEDVLGKYEFAVPWDKLSGNKAKMDRIRIIEGMIAEDAAKGGKAEWHPQGASGQRNKGVENE